MEEKHVQHTEGLLMRNFILLFTLCIVSIGLRAQIGIGTTAPNSSALIDVSSTTKGVLLPRLTQAQINAISNPSQGLKVFNLTNKTWNTYDGSRWTSEKSYVSAYVSLGDTVELGNLRVRIPSSGNKSIQVALKTSSALFTGSSLNNYRTSTAASGGSVSTQSVWVIMRETIGTTFAYWQSGLNLNYSGSFQEIHIMDETNGYMYKLRFIKGSSTNNNYLYVERLL